MIIPGLRFNVLAYFETHSHSDGGREGYVLCDISSERKTEFVTWKIGFPSYPMLAETREPIMWHGHYFRDIEAAVSDFQERAFN